MSSNHHINIFPGFYTWTSTKKWWWQPEMTVPVRIILSLPWKMDNDAIDLIKEIQWHQCSPLTLGFNEAVCCHWHIGRQWQEVGPSWIAIKCYGRWCMSGHTPQTKRQIRYKKAKAKWGWGNCLYESLYEIWFDKWKQNLVGIVIVTFLTIVSFFGEGLFLWTSTIYKTISEK